MARPQPPVWLSVQRYMQATTLVLLIGLAGAAVLVTAASALGLVGWLEVEARFGETALPQAGPVIQVALTALLVGLCFFVPTHGRVMALEVSHRNFHLTMEDVAQAYYASHAADRAGCFRLASEFDSIRARIQHLREHPELGALEPELLQLAAQMSHLGRHLAEVYSDDNVDRARLFLKQRLQEAETVRVRIENALAICQDLRRLLDRVEVEESVVESRLQMLREELDDVMPRSHRPTVTGNRPVPLRAAAE